jgi:hypothetical protein
MDLSIATAEDMVAELERRGIAVALVISHAQGGSYMPPTDVPPSRRERVIGDSFHDKHPALKAAFLCHGIQWCLNGIQWCLNDGELRTRFPTTPTAARYPVQDGRRGRERGVAAKLRGARRA